MIFIRFGLKCDRCGKAFNNYTCGDIRSCTDCGEDLCADCAAPGHRTLTRNVRRYGREDSYEDCEAESLSCEEEEERG